MTTIIMDDSQLLEIIEISLTEITNPRFFKSERGYQGELNGLISNKLKGTVQSNLISESEYQKKEVEHGLRIRPDIIIHYPFNKEYHKSRREGNLIIIELKLKGTLKKVKEDFESIDSMIDGMDYKRGIFININSTDNFSEYYKGKHRDKINFYAVKLSDDAKCSNIIK